jgi:integrase/recombinase XerC
MGSAEKIIQVDFKKKKIRTAPRKQGEGLVRSPLLGDVDSLRKNFSTATTESEFRNRLVLEILVRFGMRASELVILKKSDFILDANGNHILRYFRPKRNDFHTVKISVDAKDFLLSLIGAYHKTEIQDDHIFFSLPNHITKQRTKLTTRSLQRIVNDFGLVDGRGKSISPHSLRHYVGVRASQEKDHSVGSKLLGNSLKVFTEYYSDPTEEALT